MRQKHSCMQQFVVHSAIHFGSIMVLKSLTQTSSTGIILNICFSVLGVDCWISIYGNFLMSVIYQIKTAHQPFLDKQQYNSRKFKVVTFKHIPRASNSYAHQPANWGRETNTRCFWRDTFDWHVLPCVFSDCLNI